MGQVVSFDGSSSYDPDGSSLTYSWSFGAGASSITGAGTATPSCTYTTAGSKTVTLTVRDCDSCINCNPSTNKTSDPKTLTVTVVGVSSVSASPTNVCVGQNATFTAVSNPSGKPMNCLQWQRRWKDATSQTWGQWETVQSSANPQTYSSSSPGYCEYQARNGSGDTWKSSAVVHFLGCDCEEAGDWYSVPGTSSCPANQNPDVLLWSKQDNCGNTLELWCRGYYSFEYNSTVIGRCVYTNGVNSFRYQMTKNDYRFYATWHRSHDPDNDGSGYDEGTKNKYDWVVWKYDCINGGSVEEICRENAYGVGDEYSGESSDCE